MKYDYIIVPTNGNAAQKDVLQGALKEHGAKGWKITSTIPSANGTWIIMEKESAA